jgi:hypothetical protein
MDNRSGWITMVVATAFLAGCETTIIQRPGVLRVLTGLEMDEVTAGSAVAANDTTARALGSAAETNVSGSASAYSGTGPIADAPLLYYTNSQAIASAGGDVLTETGLSSRTSVDGANGGASIEATASASGTSRAQVDAQFNGISTNRADIVYGVVAAVACCGSGAEAQVGVNTRTGGPYSRELRATPASDTPGAAQSRIDIAVVSSTLPVLDPAQLLAASSSPRVSPKY